MAVLVCIGSGLNKQNEEYSKLVPLVKTKSGDEYLDMKNPQYVPKKYPLFKRFSNEIKEA